MSGLDDPARITELRQIIARKPALRAFYRDVYRRYAELLERCPPGPALELGSGGGFVKDVVPDIVTSDVLPYDGVDRQVDAAAMPFPDASLRAICMLNVFHHIPDVAAFLREAERCLAPGGRVLIVDQYPGLIGGPIYRWLHHEPYDPRAADWHFPSSGPLSGANGALAWIVFARDRARFLREFPRLRLAAFRRHSPLGYWLAGGLERWSLVPGFLVPAARALDRALAAVAPGLSSFVDVELVRVG
jgi:SAM-dependent methyltransferase